MKLNTVCIHGTNKRKDATHAAIPEGIRKAKGIDEYLLRLYKIMKEQKSKGRYQI